MQSPLLQLLVKESNQGDMKHKLFIILILLVALATCYVGYRYFQYRNTPMVISSYIEKNCCFEFVDTCYIDMQRVLGKEYDALYLFSGITPTEIMAERMRIPYDNGWLGDDQYRLILVDDDEVVFDRDMSRNDCNWHLPQQQAIKQHIFAVVKNENTGRYDLIPSKEE